VKKTSLVLIVILVVAILIPTAVLAGGKKSDPETQFSAASFTRTHSECLQEYIGASLFQMAGEAFAWVQFEVRDRCSNATLYSAWGGTNLNADQYSISYPDNARLFAIVYMWDQFSFEPTPVTVELFWEGVGFRDEYGNPWERFDGKKRIAKGAFPNGFRQAVPSGKVLFGGADLTEGAFSSGQISHSSGEYPPPLPVSPGGPGDPDKG